MLWADSWGRPLSLQWCRHYGTMSWGCSVGQGGWLPCFSSLSRPDFRLAQLMGWPSCLKSVYNIFLCQFSKNIGCLKPSRALLLILEEESLTLKNRPPFLPGQKDKAPLLSQFSSHWTTFFKKKKIQPWTGYCCEFLGDLSDHNKNNDKK